MTSIIERIDPFVALSIGFIDLTTKTEVSF